jgi:flagellar hook-associated protein 2
MEINGSQVNFRDIVNSLMDYERLPLKRLETKMDNYGMKLDGLKQIDKLLDTTLASLNSLSTAVSQPQYSVTSSNTSAVVVASSNDNAVAGQYNINVSQLAQSSQLISGVFNGSATVNTHNAGGFLYLTTNGSALNISILGTDTASTIATKINQADSNPGITASVLTAGSSSSPEQYLLLTSADTGAAYTITASTTIISAGVDDSGPLASFSTMTTAQDAIFTIAGKNSGGTTYTVNSASNNVSSVLQGLSLTLAATGSSVVTMSENQSAVQASITSALDTFVTNYNALNYALYANYNAAALKDGAYINIANTLRNTITANYGSGSSSVIDYLADLGLSIEPPSTYVSADGTDFRVYGNLKINVLDLQTALTEHFSDVSNFLNIPATGFIDSLETSMQSFTEARGILYMKENLLVDEQDRISLKMYKEEERLESVREQIVKRYADVESSVNRFESLGRMMEKQLEALMGNKK